MRFIMTSLHWCKASWPFLHPRQRRHNKSHLHRQHELPVIALENKLLRLILLNFLHSLRPPPELRQNEIFWAELLYLAIAALMLPKSGAGISSAEKPFLIPVP